MFLKQDTFNYGNQSVVLTELSGLQRVEYLAFVQKRTAEFDALDDAMPVADRQIEFLRMGMDINAGWFPGQCGIRTRHRMWMR